MTGQQILNADVLDILFEHRNKTYGAYQLRRTYPKRLLFALMITFSFMVLLLLLPSKGKQNILSPIHNDNEIVLRFIETVPPVEVPPVPPQAHNTNRPITPTTQFNQIVIKPDIANDETVPTQEALANTVISNLTADGDLNNGLLPPAPQGYGQSSPAPVPEPEETIAPSYTALEFPGGAEAWMRFLSRHLRAPDALQTGEKKSVLIRFLVSADGSIAQYEVLQSGGSAFDNEVIRVLKKMPKWKPAFQNGKPVTVTFTQPVTFVQQEE